MAREFQFQVDKATEILNQILKMELAGVVYYTHYSFMIYGHARIPKMPPSRWHTLRRRVR
jgi:hypothetical protein